MCVCVICYIWYYDSDSLLSGFISTRVRLWSVDMSQKTCDLICWFKGLYMCCILFLQRKYGKSCLTPGTWEPCIFRDEVNGIFGPFVEMPRGSHANKQTSPNIITKCCSFCGAIVTKIARKKVHKVHSCLSHIFLLPSMVDPRILRLPSSKAQRICNWPYLRKSWIYDWLCQLAIQVLGNQCALIIPDLPSGYLT